MHFVIVDVKLLFTGDIKTSVSINIPKIPVPFTGSGDLFAAVFMAWMTRTDNQLKSSIEKTVSTLQAVLQRTYQYCKGMKRIHKVSVPGVFTEAKPNLSTAVGKHACTSHSRPGFDPRSGQVSWVRLFWCFSSPARQISGSLRPPMSPNIIWPSLSSFIMGANDLRC